MSKAFTKDDAAEELPVIPPRAPLPPGVPNYVTPQGMALLRAELAEMEAARAGLISSTSDEAEGRRRRAVISARLTALAARVASATVVDPRGPPHDEVRFGATVTLRTRSGARPGEERRFKIVGVDEADAAHGWVAFVAPIAGAILGCHVGDTAVLHTGHGEELLEIMAIEYQTDRCHDV